MKPEKCKYIKCQECGNYKYCCERQEYEDELDIALNRKNKIQAHYIVREWLRTDV